MKLRNAEGFLLNSPLLSLGSTQFRTLPLVYVVIDISKYSTESFVCILDSWEAVLNDLLKGNATYGHCSDKITSSKMRRKRKVSSDDAL